MRLSALLAALIAAAPVSGQEAPDTLDRLALPWRIVHLAVGDTVRLGAYPLDADNRTLDVRVSWSIADTSVASIDSSGLLAALAPGTTRGKAIAASVRRLFDPRFDVVVRASAGERPVTRETLSSEEVAILAAVARAGCPAGALLDPRLPDHPLHDHGPSPRLATDSLSAAATGALLDTRCFAGVLDPSTAVRGTRFFTVSRPVHFGSREVEVVTLYCDFACQSRGYRLARRAEGWAVVHHEMRWIE